MGLFDLQQGAAVPCYPGQLDHAAGFALPHFHLVRGRHQVDQYVGLSAAVQSGRCCGLLAGKARRQQKAHRGHLCSVRAGPHSEQCVLCPQLQLLCTLVLYAGAGAGRDDRQCAGGSQHRSGQPRPGHQLADDRHGGLCGGAGKGQRHRQLVPRRAQEPRSVLRSAGLWPAGPAAVPRPLPEMAG